MELADIPDLGSGASGRKGSSPLSSTNGRQGDLPKTLVVDSVDVSVLN